MDDLKYLLNRASFEERKALADILKASKPTADSIVDRLCEKSQDAVSYVFNEIFDDQPSYQKIVRRAAKKLKIKCEKYEPASEMEVKIAQKVMATMLEKMTPEQKREMEQQLRETASQFDKGTELLGSTSIFLALTGAKLSGFGIYLLASTTLGTLTGVIGVTLPFVVYTTMSSAIAVIIGPVGWIGAGLFTIWQLTEPSYKRVIPAILFICALRARLNGGFA
ncbi:hypothetical protein NIES37_04250 [Tolypothrix tenuis PCC 7101]|uniref:Uncharacterized protein n=1 Tax=Tolypothrix tenuis PCC 7101 TaxID=231146 RepID=A0A1Z4MSP8_9CYAN|nr:hypothetical protein [Aulosira sp. FACHB-113]BAY96492.1 hypothetical protein NIES37_04250 [Tolypothrix tenuis PCC 7101]BAZ73002.1 hypothetical protein NIES50_15600 [Aulosira laxa NIES-50]